MPKHHGVIAWLSPLGSCLLALGCSSLATARIVHVDYRIFPGLAEMDGNWSALLAARDGKVYLGLTYHGGAGRLVYYDSKTDIVRDAGDLNTLCGQKSLELGPQSKIHTKFGEAKDGRIYFATEYGNDFNFARFAAKEGYPGGHWMAFDPNDGTLDLGTAFKFQGIIAGIFDPLFNRYYGITDPGGHFVYYDVATGQESDQGRVNNWDSLCRTLVVDDRGNAYGSFGHGRIFKYDPRTDSLRELSATLPIRQKGISRGRDYNKSETAWRVVVWDAPTRKFYGVEESASTLFSFDPYAGPDGEVRRLGQLCIPGFEDRREIAYATLSLTPGHDHKLYYAASGSEFDYSGSAGTAASHLITYDLRSGKIEDLGEMRLPDGRLVIGTNSAAAGADGTIYFGGAIEVPPEEGKPIEAAGRIGNVYYRLALIIVHPQSSGRSNAPAGIRRAGGRDAGHGAVLPLKKTGALAVEWDLRRSKIHTHDEIEARNRFVREKCVEMIPGLPRGNRLKAVTVRVLERDSY